MTSPRLVLIGAVAFVAAACVDPTEPLPADPGIALSKITFHQRQTFSMPFSDVVLNQCTGEDVQVDGTLHITSIFLQGGDMDPDVFAVVEVHFNASNLRGVGLVTGKEYRSYFARNNIAVTQFPVPSIAVVTFRSSFRELGSSESSTIVATGHLIINALGEIAVEHHDLAIVCG